MRKRVIIALVGACLLLAYGVAVKKWPGLFRGGLVSKAEVLTLSSTSVHDDPLIRMPGTQPAQGVSIEAPNRCLNCHAEYNHAVEPGFNWKGSMMAQAARDPLFWACMTVAGQDSMWALNGSPNAVDLCERCHFPEGWLGGRSDPPNASAMTGSDFDGVHCDFCHRMWDPFFETTFSGAREGNDWTGYWDEAGNTGTTATLSQSEAGRTHAEDRVLSTYVTLFSGAGFYSNYLPKYNSTYTESASGQYFVSTGAEKRASFADAEARHRMLYSRQHKSKYFCGTCHDVSNPVLANLGHSGLPSGGADLITEQYSASQYFHVERTFSEFMLSAYGQQGGAPGVGPFAPEGFKTSYANNYIAKCQDCHMRDVTGAGCNKAGVPVRPGGSTEHPNSGLPLHDLTGGNVWVPYLLASTVSGSPNYDSTNFSLLSQGASVLTLDLTQGQGLDPAALLAGVARAKEQLKLAAAIENISYSPSSGALSFRVRNHTGHKLISGFPEGRRMFVNVRAYGSDGRLLLEVNPYDYDVGTLKGFPGAVPLSASEAYVDELVYEAHPSSTLTGENETFHFVLATGRYKDNRIPPKGFRISEASERLAEPWYGGAQAINYFSSDEYAEGYDAVSLNIAPGAQYVEVNLYYQSTSREYVEFLRDEINGTAGRTTLPSGAYVIQADPFFAKLKAWGNTIWQLWEHNKNIDGARPFLMAQAVAGTPPAPACTTPSAPSLTATAVRRSITVTWSQVNPTGGYRLYYDQAGKRQLIASLPPSATSYTDRNLARNTQYCYVVEAWNDCNGNGAYDAGTDYSSSSAAACATTQ